MVRILGVVSQCNMSVTHDMEKEVRGYFDNLGVDFDTCYVPGALEIPSAISFAIVGDKTHYDGYVALGCVIKGATDHYEHVSRECMRGIMDVSIQHMVPVCNGVITARNMSDARARSRRSSENNVGLHAAKAVIKMVEVYKSFV